MWAMINQLQLLLLLLITGAYLPKDIRDYISGMEFSMFSLSFLSIKSIQIVEYSIGWIDFDQSNHRIGGSGIESGIGNINI